MIKIDYLKSRVEQLARKARGAGYASKDEFNSDIAEAQTASFEYYLQIFEQTKKVSDALIPFIVEATLTLDSKGKVVFPPDYRHWLEVGYNYVVNSDCGEEPEQQWCPVDYMRAHEEKYTLRSAIRKPSITKKIFRWTSKNNMIYVYPAVQNIEFKYFKNPPAAVWDSTITSTPTGDAELYDAANSTDLIWNEAELSSFVDVLLAYLGIQIKDTELVQFAMSKRQIQNAL